jgi:uncharacterized SAM-binding protein YcdF (DUF218 family)
MSLKLKTNLKYFLLGFLTFFILWSLCFGLFFWFAGDWLIIRDTPVRADVIHVLGGDSVDFHRARHGVDLYKAGVADTLVFSSVGMDLQNVLKASERFGLPLAHRLALDSCQSTWDEAMAVKNLNRPWKSIILITDQYHTRRAVHTFQNVLPHIKIYSSPAFNSTYSTERWWKTESGLVAVFTESLKIPYYWVKYGVKP